ncbi:MAG TPA: phospholipase D-like domain-containing protein [Planctomycetota bacterium]|nr:phospholipase D-like domain-containing protein [Planctomycetota bacterium]
MIHRLIDHALSQDVPDAALPVLEPVVSLPSPLKNPLGTRIPGLLTTDQVFRRLLDSAKKSLKIFSPYVDNSFTGMAQDAQVPIQIVTSLRDNKQKSSPVLERFSTTKPLAVRYLREMQGKVQMYQLHAKMILADDVLAYIGSANFTDTSLHYNFELGVLTEERAVITRLHAIFDYVFGFAARPAGQA